jgi:hypothetical protein
MPLDLLAETHVLITAKADWKHAAFAFMHRFSEAVRPLSVAVAVRAAPPLARPPFWISRQCRLPVYMGDDAKITDKVEPFPKRDPCSGWFWEKLPKNWSKAHFFYNSGKGAGSQEGGSSWLH